MLSLGRVSLHRIANQLPTGYEKSLLGSITQMPPKAT